MPARPGPVSAALTERPPLAAPWRRLAHERPVEDHRIVGGPASTGYRSDAPGRSFATVESRSTWKPRTYGNVPCHWRSTARV